MIDISFYHIQKDPLEKALAKLLEKALNANQRVIVLCESSERVEALNSFLWTYSPQAFLPHGTKKEGFPEHQPIWLTNTLENPNNASILMVLDGRKIDDFKGFNRCLDLFDGSSETHLQEARDRWLYYRQNSHTLSYWQQSSTGTWEHKPV